MSRMPAAAKPRLLNTRAAARRISIRRRSARRPTLFEPSFEYRTTVHIIKPERPPAPLAAVKRDGVLADLLRQRTGPELELHDLRAGAAAAFHVKRRARGSRRPESLALPAGVRVVDPAVHPLRVVAGRIRHTHDDPLAV